MRLGKWHRRLLLASLIAVAATGALWFALHDLMEREPSTLLRMLLAIHGVASFASAVAFGSILPLHMPAGYRRGQNRITGVALVSAMTILIVSALVLYYGSEEAQRWARLVHLVVGFAAVIGVPLHIVLGRRNRQIGATAAAGSCPRSRQPVDRTDACRL